MEILIREGKEEDCESIGKLIEKLARSEKHGEWIDDAEQLRKDGFQDSPWFRTFLAEDKSDGKCKIVGLTLYYYCYSLTNGRCVHMEALYVDEEYRAKNIGTRLWKAIAKEAIAKDCNLMEIGVLKGNTEARGFYARQGTIDLTEEGGVHVLAMHRSELNKLALK